VWAKRSVLLLKLVVHADPLDLGRRSAVGGDGFGSLVAKDIRHARCSLCPHYAIFVAEMSSPRNVVNSVSFLWQLLSAKVDSAVI
jgi:hypothetical protein